MSLKYEPASVPQHISRAECRGLTERREVSGEAPRHQPLRMFGWCINPCECSVERGWDGEGGAPNLIDVPVGGKSEKLLSKLRKRRLQRSVLVLPARVLPGGGLRVEGGGWRVEG